MDETVELIQKLTDAAVGRTEPPLLVPTVDRSRIQLELGVIEEHGAVDTMPTPAGSLRAVKQAVLRLGAFNWARQRAVNHSVGQALASVLAELDELRAVVAQNDRRNAVAAAASAAGLEALRTQTATSRELNTLTQRLDDEAQDLRQQLSDATRELAALTTQLETRSTELETHAVRIDALHADVAALQTRLLVEQRHTAALRGEIARMRIGEGSSLDEGALPLVPQDVAEMYERFEAAFRPSNAELDARFEEYLDVLGELRETTFPLIDIGAGRGEFVAILERHGIVGRGVDLNKDAVAEAQQHGRPVEHADAIDYLRSLDTESVGAISLFHVIEHLDATTTLSLLDECLRVLRPGGIIIIETPNPTNLVVGAAAFYQDPTHIRPVVPAFLEFLMRDRGFTDVTTKFLHPLPEYELELSVPEGRGSRATQLLLDDVKWALKGPQDYAVIARRAAGS